MPTLSTLCYTEKLDLRDNIPTLEYFFVMTEYILVWDYEHQTV